MLDFETLDTLLYTPPIKPAVPMPFGFCNHNVQLIQGTWTCIECGFETYLQLESNLQFSSNRKLYSPVERFRDLLDEYTLNKCKISLEVVNTMKEFKFANRTCVRKWLVKNDPKNADDSVEAFFRIYNHCMLDIGQDVKQAMLNDYTKFLDFHHSKFSKSSPNQQFCLVMLLEQYGIPYPEGSVVPPKSSFLQNLALWGEWKKSLHV